MAFLLALSQIEERGAALLEEAEKNGHSLQSSPCVEANNRALLGEANCLPLAMSAEIRSTYGRMRNSSKDDEARNAMEMLANLRLTLGEDDSLRNSVDDKVKASDVEQWFDVENDDDVRDAVVRDFDDEWRRSQLNSCVRG